MLTDKAVEIVHTLGPSWPILVTLTCLSEQDGKPAAIDRFVGAVNMLRDLGLVACDALAVTRDRATALDCALTPRGREYFQSLRRPMSDYAPGQHERLRRAVG